MIDAITPAERLAAIEAGYTPADNLAARQIETRRWMQDSGMYLNPRPKQQPGAMAEGRTGAGIRRVYP